MRDACCERLDTQGHKDTRTRGHKGSVILPIARFCDEAGIMIAVTPRPGDRASARAHERVLPRTSRRCTPPPTCRSRRSPVLRSVSLHNPQASCGSTHSPHSLPRCLGYSAQTVQGRPAALGSTAVQSITSRAGCCPLLSAGCPASDCIEHGEPAALPRTRLPDA